MIHPASRWRARRLRVLAFALATLSHADAAIFTWTGNGPPGSDTEWSLPLNWTGLQAPTGIGITDSLTFSGAQGSVVNDIRDRFLLNQLRVDAGGGTLLVSGQSLQFAGVDPAIEVSGGTLMLTAGLAGAANLDKIGAGTLMLAGGSSAFEGDVRIRLGTLQTTGRDPLGATSRVTVLPGTRFVIGSGDAFGGFSGFGRVTLDATAAVTYAGDATFAGTLDGSGGFRKSGPGTFTMTGRSVALGRTDVRSGAFVLSGEGATWGGSGLAIGAGAFVRLLDGSRWDLGVGDLTLDEAGGATVPQLLVAGGSHLSGGSGILGRLAGNTADARVEGQAADGTRSTWDVSGGLGIGAAGRARLTIADGGLVRATGAVNVGAGSTLRLEGGDLEAGDLSFAATSTLDWTRGALRITGADGLHVNAAAPGSLGNLVAGRDITTERLTIDHGATVALQGGSLVTGEIVLRDGRITTTPDRALALGIVGRISGAGEIRARYGHQSVHTLRAEGGVLTLKDNDGTPLRLDGTIEVATSGTLIVDAEGVTMLNGRVTLEEGGRLGSVHGLALSGLQFVEAGRDAQIDGPFTVGNQILGPNDAGHPLVMTGAVDGGALITGYTRFLGVHSPGLGIGRAFIQNASYAGTAVLRMEIAGTAARTGHDQLVVGGFENGDGRLELDGTLEIDFLPGFAARAGDSFTLIQYGNRTGTFARLATSGLAPGLVPTLDYGDRALVLRVSAAPEPGEWALLLLGLGALGWRCRRRG